MSKREAVILFEDIKVAIDKILIYTKDMDNNVFITDIKTIDAVVRNLEIIGEAANHLHSEFLGTYSGINWKQIIGLRRRIVHNYFGVDFQNMANYMDCDRKGYSKVKRRYYFCFIKFIALKSALYTQK